MNHDIEKVRELFESIYPTPSACQWIGTTYAATSFNAWDAHDHQRRWEGFKSAFGQLVKLRAEYVTGRKALNALYLEYVNNYLTVEKFAEHQGLTTDQGQRLIELAREIHNSPHPEG